MLGAAGLSLLIGLMPRPFVDTAADAHIAIHPNAEAPSH